MDQIEHAAEILVEVHRGPIYESAHLGHAVIWHHDSGSVAEWGNAQVRILPRSSTKMIQALPLIESGAADARGLTSRQLALACASHNGAAIHTVPVREWLADLGLDETDLRCGAHSPKDHPARDALIKAEKSADQTHNNCSGKHCGFLTLSRHLGAGPEYVAPDHPVQRAVSEAWDDVTGESSPGYGIDGCSAPNFITGLTGLARAMAAFAAAAPEGGIRQSAMVRLREAMMQHPELVAGEGRACTGLMRAMGGRAAIKTGAEGVFTAIVPELRIGVALKIADGAARGAEAVMAQILVGLGVLDPAHPEAILRLHGPITNCRGVETGHLHMHPTLAQWRL